MSLLCQQINRIAIVAIMAIVFSACTEKAADSNSVEKVVSTVAEDKITQLQRQAQQGDPDAQYELAYLYENGLGVPKSETRALELYQQAADQGRPAAQDNLDAMSKPK
ncbi:tetratricopeptide repeat protein [Methylobacter psychrophilus]|uniref:tetratricopeptide repeat protein n=1 Tax=Methylobacter psychrophilus TaxID=96941 RepID=UPI0021D5079E|nr:SEL1-like repeat protein [Methylobacter psychrophilus]